jgi:cytochrome P450
MHFLLEHPETFKRLAEEVKSFYPDLDTRIAYKDVLSMKYLDAVFHESMRLRPIAPHGMPRIIAEGGTTLDGYFVPGGVSTYIYIYM